MKGDQARVSTLVRVAPEEAFRVFTTEIDAWWRRGMAYRMSGGPIVLEPKPGGRLIEKLDDQRERVFGRVLEWQPPKRLLLEWRAANFAPEEKTEVEVLFARSPSGTLVTITHRGWAQIRKDHPVRHGSPSKPFLRQLATWWSQLATSLREHAEANVC
ncbi:MAG: SRPBCC domain-containing protein [Myxococcota bacterium]